MVRLIEDLHDWSTGHFRVGTEPATDAGRELFRITAAGLLPGAVVAGVTHDIGLTVGVLWLGCFGMAAYYRNWH